MPPFVHKWKGQVMRALYDNGGEHTEGFDQYLHENYDEVFVPIIEKIALLAARKDFDAISRLWENSRHTTGMREKDSDFKLNNNWKADIARIALNAYPQFKGFFALRRRRAKNLGCYEPEL